MSVIPAETQSEVKQPRDMDEMLCGCSAITVRQYYDHLAANPKDFDEVLRDTGAGQNCTACLLDLEYHYVRAAEMRARSGATAKIKKISMQEKPSLKRRIYNLIDAMSPLVPINLRQVAPVVYGAGVKEWLCVCNDSLLYEGDVQAPPFLLEIILRNGEGRIVHKENRVVGAGEKTRVDLSTPMEKSDPSDNGELKLGWMDLMRRAQVPGVRGTTRPQFEIMSKAGVCAVHTQTMSERSQGGLTIRLRPGEDRHFASVVNAESKPLEFKMTVSAQGLPDTRLTVKIPPFGARLVEVPMPAVTNSDGLGTLAEVTWTTDRMNKVYVLCATPSLDRFSVDHA